jgi:hypothetical protein
MDAQPTFWLFKTDFCPDNMTPPFWIRSRDLPSSPKAQQQPTQPKFPRTDGEVVTFLSLPRELRHNILGQTYKFEPLDYLQWKHYTKGDVVMEDWIEVLRNVDDRLKDDVDYMEPIWKKEVRTWVRQWFVKGEANCVANVDWMHYKTVPLPGP